MFFSQVGLFNFRPVVRPVPLEVHIHGFLLSSHGHNEQTTVPGHLYPLTTEANTGVCVLTSTNSSHYHGPNNISGYTRQPQAMGSYARA